MLDGDEKRVAMLREQVVGRRVEQRRRSMSDLRAGQQDVARVVDEDQHLDGVDRLEVHRLHGSDL